MNWAAIGAIGELVGALAVIATLLYLAAQIRASRVHTTSSNVQGALQSFNPLNVAVGSDPQLCDLVTRGLYDYTSLNEQQRVQYAYLQRAYFNCFFNVYLQYKLGTFSEKEWLPYAYQVAHLLSQPGPIAFRENDRTYEEMFAAIDEMDLDPKHLSLDMTRNPQGGA